MTVPEEPVCGCDTHDNTRNLFFVVEKVVNNILLICNLSGTYITIIFLLYKARELLEERTVKELKVYIDLDYDESQGLDCKRPISRLPEYDA